MKNIIAIDVGNGFCKAAILLDSSEDPLNLMPPQMTMGMPSIAYVEANGKISVNCNKIPPKSEAIRDVKTHLGKEVLELSAGGTSFTVEPGKVYGAIACELVRLANEALRQRSMEPAYQVVVTYPSEFIDTPKPGIMKRNIEAQVLDGHQLEVIAMLPEPVAAAIDTLYYEHHIKLNNLKKGNHSIAVYDLGHGTLDLAVVSSTDDKSCPFDVVCQYFPTMVDVCGRVFDEKIYDRLLRQLGGDQPFKPSARDYRELRFKHTVDMKHALSDRQNTSVEFFADGMEDAAELAMSRKEFETIISPDINRTIECVAQLLQDAQKKNVNVQEIVLTGGASRIPLIEQMLTQTFSNAGIHIRSFRPSFAVVNGAARYAQQIVVKQRAEYAYGIFIDKTNSVTTLITPDDTLAANSKPQEFAANSNTMTLRVCRSKNRHTTASQIPYRDCTEIRRFRFDSVTDQPYKLALSIDEDRRVTLSCTDPNGNTIKKSTFDPV